MSSYLVAGGAGFIGSHLTKQLHRAGHTVVVLDNLSQGHAEAVPAGVELAVLDLSDIAGVDRLFARHRFDAVFHFAALSQVGESMRDPLRYCRDNVANTLDLAQAAVRAGCLRFVLSSTAALFLPPRDGSAIGQDAAPDPQNAYGDSKWMIERALAWADRAHGLRTASLRYFNASGCDAEGELGEDHTPETHLIPLAIDAALGRRGPLELFGTDYNTPDGTAIRDYVHVDDLAAAHIAVLAQLEIGSCHYNLGTGIGSSVRQVLEAVERLSGLKVPVIERPRRDGDPAVLVAQSAAFEADTGWRPKLRRLDDVVGTALSWRTRHPHGYTSRRRLRLVAAA